MNNFYSKVKKMLLNKTLSTKWSGRIIMIAIIIEYLSIGVSASEWSIVPIPNIENVQFNTIHGDSEQSIFIGGEGGTILYYDGNSWQQQIQFTDLDIMVIRGDSITGFMATGFNETEISSVFKYTNNVWQTLENPPDSEGIMYLDILSNPQDVFVVGMLPNMYFGANMLATIDGNSVSLMESPDDCFYCFFKGIWGNASDNFFLLSIDYQYPLMMLNIYQYCDTKISVLASYETAILGGMPIGGIWGSSNTDIYVVNNGSIIHFNGLEWKSSDMNQNGNTYELLKVWGRDTNDIFVSGIKNETGGVIFHFDGHEWREMSLPDECLNSPVSEIWGTENILYALGQTGFLMTYQKPIHLNLPSQADESSGLLMNTGMVWIDAPTESDLTITLFSDNISELTVPSTIVIPAGLTQVTFDLTVVDDSIFDGTQKVLISASAHDYGDTSAEIKITDNEKATLTLTIPEIAFENDGVLEKQGKVSCNITVEKDISVQFISSDPSEISVPENVIIKGGENFANFDITIIDDNEFDNTQTVSLTAIVEGWVSSCQQIQVEDDEIKSLMLIVPNEIYEDDSPLTHQGKISVPGVLKENLSVYLVSEHPQDLTCPQSVTIPSGYSFTTFYLVATDDTITDESQSISLSATATGWNSFTQIVQVLNNDPGYIQFKHHSYTVDANQTSISVSVIRTRSYSGSISVDYYTTDESANAGKDYIHSNGTLVFNDGEYLKTISIEIMQQNRLWHKVFNIQLTYLNNGDQYSDKTTINLMAQKQWQWFYPKLTGDTINRIWGVSENSLFAVGKNGTIIHYDGSFWSLMDCPFSNDLNAIWGTDENYIFVVGNEGLILYYNGQQWQSMPNPAHGNLVDIWGTSANNVYACGQTDNNYGVILHYNGNAWSKSIDRLPVPVSGISGRNENEIYAIGSIYDSEKYEYRGIVFCFNGYQWFILKEFMSNLYAIAVDENSVIISGSSGQLYEYDGNQWTLSTINQSISRITFTPEKTLYALSSYGQIYQKNDDQWPLYTDCSIEISDLWMNENYFYVVGPNGTIIKINRSSGKVLSNTRNFQINDMWSQSQTMYFAATSPDGYSSYLLTSDGNHLTETVIYSDHSFFPSTINNIWGTSDNTFYTFFSDGSIYHYDGFTLNPMTTPSFESYESVMDIWGSDNDIYAITSEASIIHLTETQWEKMEVPFEKGWLDAFSIWSDDRQDVYVTSNNDAYHFDGIQWSEISLSSSIYNVFGIHDDLFFSVCERIIRINGDNKESMTMARNNLLGCLYETWGTSENHLFSGGDSGVIFHYNKGIWNEMTTPADMAVKKLWGDPSGFDVYAILSNHTVMCYTRSFLLNTPDHVDESNQILEKSASVHIRQPSHENTIVYLLSSDPSRLKLSDHVIIPAGQTSVSFDIQVLDDEQFNNANEIIITAQLSSQLTTSVSIIISDNEYGQLKMDIPEIVQETDGQIQHRISISNAIDTDLVISIQSSNPSAIIAPNVVTIGAGSTSQWFHLTIVDNMVINGNSSITITASTPNWVTSTVICTVIDNESGRLSLVLPNEVNEADGILNQQGLVTIESQFSEQVDVLLLSSSPAAITVSSIVSIPPGYTQTAFDLMVMDNEYLDTPMPVTITASIPQWMTSATEVITVLDNESHQLSVSVPQQVTETDGLLISMGHITTGGLVYNDLVVNLSSSRSDIIDIPDHITIPAGQNTQVFNIQVLYHSDCGDGNAIVIRADSDELSGQSDIYVKDNEGTCIGGYIYNDLDLKQFHSPYYVQDSLYIQSTLTIEPGVTIKFSSNTGIFVGINSYSTSALIAEGTSELPVVFTSAKDFPEPGDWLGIYLGSHTDDEATHMKHCIIEYGGQDADQINGNIEINYSAPTITQSIISNSLSHGIYIENNTGSVINNNIFNHNNGAVISVNNPDSLNDIEDNTGSGNSNHCIRLSSGSIIQGKTIWKKNNNIPYVIETYINLYSNAMLIIEEGVIIKFEKNAGLGINENASLIAQGSPTSPIIFTSTANSPNPQDWKGINLYHPAPSCIEHCLIEYGGNNSNGTNIYSEYAKQTIIQNNTIRHAITGLYLHAVNPETFVQCNQIMDNDIGVRIENTNFSIHYNNIVNNQSYALYQSTNDTVDATNNYWGDANGPGQALNALLGNITYIPFLVSESVCEQVTLTNYSPFIPEQPVPENEAINVQLDDESVMLQWTGTDPNLWDSVVYDVYLGENAQHLTPIVQNLANNLFQANDLESGHLYYWQVISRDLSGAETPGQIWYFVTQGDLPDIIVSAIIQTPETELVCGIPITFTAMIQNTGHGPLVDPMKVRFYMNDSYLTVIDVDSILLSGESMALSYVWQSEAGEYTITVSADDNSLINETNENNNSHQQYVAFISDITAPYLSYAYPKNNQFYTDIRYVDLKFQDDCGGTLNTSAMANNIMVSMGNHQIEGTIRLNDTNTFRFIPESVPLTNGQYVVSCTAIDMAGNTKDEQLTFFIDQESPHQPIITGGEVFSGNLQPRPFDNLTKENCFDLKGYSDESLDCQLTEYHPEIYNGYDHYDAFNVSGNWSKRICVYEGLSTIRVYYEDQAGNQSPYEWIDIIYDSIAPELLSITPVHNCFMSTPPETIHIQFKEETSGISMYSSTVQVKTADQEVIQGEWAITDESTITYTPTHAFEENLYFVSVILKDRLNHQSLPQIIEFTVDATPPSPPVNLDYPPLTPVSKPLVKGTKEAWASIWLNGQLIVEHTPSIFWEYTLTVQSGPNAFTLFARDRAGNSSENIYIDINYDDTPPPPIEHVMVNDAFDGKTIIIDWSSYDASGAGDIASYDIYLKTESFGDLSSLTSYDTVSGDIMQYTFSQLSRDTSYYMAIIPKDMAGAVPASFTPISATPLDVFPPENVTHIHGEICRTAIRFSWEPSLDSDNDLLAYILLLNNEQESITLPVNIHAYTFFHLTPSTEYTLTVMSMDNDHNISSGSSLTIVTILDHPQFTVTTHDQSIEAQWSQVNPAKYVSHYAIYVENQWYTSTYQLTPFLVTQNLSTFLTDLNKYQDYYIAVGTVNVSGGQADTITPVLARPATEVLNVYANYFSPCQTMDDYKLTIEFSASMDITKAPVIEMISSAKSSPTVYSGGTWKTIRYENDTYVTSDILLSAEMAGEITVNIVEAKDFNGYETIPHPMAYTFVLNATVPDPPVLSLQKLTQESTIICWEYDTLSEKIAWFYMYQSLSPFTDLTAVSPIAISDQTTRFFDFGHINPDQSVYIAVVPRDVYGNMAKTVTPEELRISGVISFHRNYYTLADSPIISYSSAHMNQHPDRIDSVVLTLSSDSDPTGITLLLFETQINSSMFSSESIIPQPTFSFDDSNGLNHILHVSNGDTIRVLSHNLESLSYQGYAVMDCDPPLSELNVSGLYYTQDIHIYITPLTNFSVTATDTASGIASVRCSMDGGPFDICPQSFRFQTEGFHHLIFQSEDIAGNIETVHQQDIIVDTMPPEPPEGISSSLNDDNATISWNSSPENDVIRYYVYKNGLRITPEGTTRTYYSDPLIPGRRSTYHITAMDRLYNESQFSKPAIMSLPGNAPEITKPDNGVYLLSSNVKISGKSDPGSVIEIQKNASFYGTTLSNDSGIFHFLSLQLDEGLNRIRAIATTNYGVKSPESPETMIYFYSNPSMVTGLLTESLDTRINLSWNPVIDQAAVAYRIYRDGICIGETMSDQFNFMDKCLTNGKTYEYQITIINENGMEGPPGEAVLEMPEGEW